MKQLRLSSMRVIPLSFLIVILIGGLLLMLPISSADGSTTDFISALFTATTSTCVTGLIVVDTYSHWSLFGHIVILCLIQIGGLGVITVISMGMFLSQKKFSLGDRKMLQDALSLNTDIGVLKILRNIIWGTLIVETAGTIVYATVFVPEFGWQRGLWVSLFNSVSAFCNAGMDIIGGTGFAGYYANPVVLINTMVLIVLGGLGFVVWFDVLSTVRKGIKSKFTPKQIFKRFGEHTKLVLIVTMILIVVGAVFIFAAEYTNPNTIGDMSLSNKILNSFFESVTFRTAGFATVGQEALTEYSCVIAYFLMFIGGSPIGTAGGIKTIAFYLAIMNVVSYVKGEEDCVVFKRRISNEAMRKATVIAALSATTVIFMTLLLLATNPVRVSDGLFEVISALATVGLTRDLTTSLNSIGRIIIIICMYLGRIGPISLAVFFAGRVNKKSGPKYTEGKFYIG